MSSHPLLALFHSAAAGHFPAADGECEVVEPLPNGLEASIAFTGHAVVATTVDPSEVARRSPDGFGSSLAPDFLRWLAGDGEIGVVDATLCARGRGGKPCLPIVDIDHPRVRHAHALRDNVEVYGDARGLVTLSDGIAGRRELSVELYGGHGAGQGRALLSDALTLIPESDPVFAAVSPGNARSLRAFLSLGFVPIGSEVIVRPDRGA